jgi:hypothetical protein
MSATADPDMSMVVESDCRKQRATEEASRGKDRGACIAALYLSSCHRGERELEYPKAPTIPSERAERKVKQKRISLSLKYSMISSKPGPLIWSLS